jgi:16S rRNA (cytidine1402-2'-O)-methyltransferase
MQKSFKDPKPTLFVVATPIGNLKDISYRAIEILNEVDVILAEDTRTSSVLLNHYQNNIQLKVKIISGLMLMLNLLKIS